jgi:hypothetical protein
MKAKRKKSKVVAKRTKAGDVSVKRIADNNIAGMERLLAGKDSFEANEGKTSRLTDSKWKLLARTIGGPRLIAAKIGRLFNFIYLVFNVREVNRRLNRLKEKGFIENIPSHKQLIFGSLDMLRYFIAPGANDYYKSRGINFVFHQVLRFFDDPVGLMDPIGVRLSKDSIIGHVLGVVHANPVYDLQLLEMFPDGLDEIEKQTEQMVHGTHKAQKSIGSIVEDPEYHSRLLDLIRRYRKDPLTKPLIRRAGNMRSNPNFILAECMYGTMPSAMRYMSRLPKGFFALVKHYFREKTINPKYCDAHVVESWHKIYGKKASNLATPAAA